MGLFDFLRGVRRDESADSLPSPDSLHVDIANGWDDSARRHIQQGVDIEHPFLGMRPLHLVARKGNRALVALLVQKGAQIRSRDSSGHFPVFYAAEERHHNVLRLLLAEHARDWGDQTEMNGMLYEDEATSLVQLFAAIMGGPRNLIVTTEDLPFAQETFLAALAIEIQRCERHGTGKDHLALVRSVGLHIFDFYDVDPEDVDTVYRLNGDPRSRRDLRELDPHKDADFMRLFLQITAKYNKRAIDQTDTMPDYPYSYHARE